jgi:hypothetical protein
MKTFHEWLAGRIAKNEGLWLNDKNAVVGLSNINPLLQKKAKVKPLKLPKAKLGVAGATPKPFKAMAQAAFKPMFGNGGRFAPRTDLICHAESVVFGTVRPMMPACRKPVRIHSTFYGAGEDAWDRQAGSMSWIILSRLASCSRHSRTCSAVIFCGFRRRTWSRTPNK